MAARDFFAGAASAFLMLAKIVLCLVFTVHDRLERAIAERRRGANGIGDRPALPTTAG